MARPFLSAAAASILSISAAFPAAAQQMTIKVEQQSEGAGIALRATTGKTFIGNMTVNCDTPFVSFYKSGTPTSIKIADGIAREVAVLSDGPAMEANPIAMPSDLDPAKLCVAGRPDIPAAKAVFIDRLAKN